MLLPRKKWTLNLSDDIKRSALLTKKKIEKLRKDLISNWLRKVEAEETSSMSELKAGLQILSISNKEEFEEFPGSSDIVKKAQRRLKCIQGENEKKLQREREREENKKRCRKTKCYLCAAILALVIPCIISSIVYAVILGIQNGHGEDMLFGAIIVLCFVGGCLACVLACED